MPLSDRDFLRPLAQGVPAPGPAPLRRTRLFLETVGQALSGGEFVPRLPATNGLSASEWRTRQQGSVAFVQNPTDAPVTGGVFPGLSEITLEPGDVFPWVHDFPIGPSATYLSAYAGLVKCDARLLTAHIRPDPFVGARVFVWGTPGTTRTVVLFGSKGGEETAVTFSGVPQVYEAAESQVVAVPESLADEVYPPADPQGSLAPTTIGPDWLLWPDGTLEKPSEWPEAKTLSGWLWTSVTIPSETGARLDGVSGELWVNGVPTKPDDLTLAAGENSLLLHVETPLNDAPLLIPDGACYLLELSAWRSRRED